MRTITLTAGIVSSTSARNTGEKECQLSNVTTVTTLLTKNKAAAPSLTNLLTENSSKSTANVNSVQNFMTSHKSFKNLKDNTEIKKSLNTEISNVSSSTSALTPKKRRLVPHAALNLLRRRRDLQIHSFFQRHNSSQKHLIQPNSSVNNFSVPLTLPEVETQCLAEESAPPQTTCSESTSSSATLADERSDVFHVSTMTPTHKTSVLTNSRVQRRDISGDFHQSATSTPTHGQMSTSASVTTNLGNSSGHYHLNLLPGSSGLHARRESFLYRASDEREPLFNIAPLLATCRPVSRASSVASSDPQYVNIFVLI